jgi:hypothetical protein
MNIDLNIAEIIRIIQSIELAKVEMESNPYSKIDKQTLKIRLNEMQSIIYKLEKFVPSDILSKYRDENEED